MYSGNCFLNREVFLRSVITRKGLAMAMAVALDDDLNEWQKLPSNPITPITKPGDRFHDQYRSWDPYGWEEDGTYYAIFGGKRPAIAKASKLEGEWQYVGDLFAHGVEDVALDEDVSCPDLFELGDKHVLLCISHRLGCRYYIGEWRDEQFFPESHAKMSWVDNSFFAPESLVDDEGRRIMWAWIMDEPEFGVRSEFGWSGVLSLPRELSISKNGSLLIDVPAEVGLLRQREFRQDNISLLDGVDATHPDVNGRSFELAIEFQRTNADEYGVKVCASPNGKKRRWFISTPKRTNSKSTRESLDPTIRQKRLKRHHLN